MDSLFDDFERTSEQPAHYTESNYVFLNTSAKQGHSKARQLIDEWYGDYAKSAGTEEAKRIFKDFTSSENSKHRAALSELWVYNYLHKLGFLLKVHPQLPSGKHPDFFVEHEDGTKAYVEVTTTAQSPDRSRVKKVQNKLLDVIDSIKSPQFLISVRFKRSGDVEPSYNTIRTILQNFISELDWTVVCGQIESSGICPRFFHEDRGWELEFDISPVNKEGLRQRTAESRNVGAYQYPMSMVTLDQELVKLVDRKRVYRDVGHPLLLVVNVVDGATWCDDNLMLEALFGKETITFSVGEHRIRNERVSRTFNGIWIKPGQGWVNKDFSGLWMLKDLAGWNLKPDSKIWLHPKPRNPLDNPGRFEVPVKSLNIETGQIETSGEEKLEG